MSASYLGRTKQTGVVLKVGIRVGYIGEVPQEGDEAESTHLVERKFSKKAVKSVSGAELQPGDEVTYHLVEVKGEEGATEQTHEVDGIVQLRSGSIPQKFKEIAQVRIDELAREEKRLKNKHKRERAKAKQTQQTQLHRYIEAQYAHALDRGDPSVVASVSTRLHSRYAPRFEYVPTAYEGIPQSLLCCTLTCDAFPFGFQGVGMTRKEAFVLACEKYSFVIRALQESGILELSTLHGEVSSIFPESDEEMPVTHTHTNVKAAAAAAKAIAEKGKETYTAPRAIHRRTDTDTKTEEA